ncbi:MAG: riboflavin kinase, partial [Clostridia bacterium]
PTYDIAIQTVEAHIIGFTGNLYGKDMKISLNKYIRPIIKFSNGAELSAQLRKDVLEAKL